MERHETTPTCGVIKVPLLNHQVSGLWGRIISDLKLGRTARACVYFCLKLFWMTTIIHLLNVAYKRIHICITICNV